MDESPDETAGSAMATLVRRAGEPLPPDIRRRIRSTIGDQLAGDLIVDTFDDLNPEDASTPTPTSVPARRQRWLLASAAAVVAAVGIGWVFTVTDRGDAPRTTTLEQTSPTTADAMRRRTVSVVSTASPTGELSVRRVGVLGEPGFLSEFLPDGRLLRRRPTESGEMVTLYHREGGVDVSTMLPRGPSVAGAGDRTMRDVAVGPDDVLYTSYLTSVTPDGWHFDVVAFSFEQRPREIGRWPSFRACLGQCGDVVLAADGVIIDEQGGVVPYVDPATGEPSGKRQYYVLDAVQASYDVIREDGSSGLDATVSYGDEKWTLRINGTPLPDVSAEVPIDLQPQRDGSLLGVLFGDRGDSHPFYVLWLRPGGGVKLYGLDGSVLPRVMYSAGGVSILAVGLDTESRREVLVRL